MSDKLKIQLNTKDEVFDDILSNSKQYFVPRFQRDYSWDEEHWGDFWEDAQRLLANPDEYHYMGYLVLQTLPKDRQYKIIDGQQRLTTFSLLVLAAMKRLERMSAEPGRIEKMRRTYIGDRDYVNFRFENKLVLNRNNDFYYGLAVEGQEIPNTGVKRTVRLMRRALDYFFGRLGALDTAGQIGELLRVVSQKMLFTTIYIGDAMTAFNVFETLNARGMKLSSADLLKNYLFALVDPADNAPNEVLDKQDAKWSQIGDNIKDKTYTDYILTEWNSRHRFVRPTNLFKQITAEIKNAQQVYDYINILREKSQLYSALLNVDGEFFKNHPSYTGIRKDLSCLDLFGIKKPSSLLMASYTHLPDDFARILQWIKILSLRYNIICGGNPVTQEKRYSEIAHGIHNDGWGAAEVKNNLLSINPTDEKFHRDFADKSMPPEYPNKRARYLLARLAEFQNPGESIDETELSVEHILPLNADAHWEDYFGSQWMSYTHRLGNMVLVTPAVNKTLDQKPFGEKQEILSAQSYSKEIGNYADWAPDTIKSRQEKLAKTATALWRIE